MPKVVIPINDVESSIVRPIAMAIIRDIVEYTGIPVGNNIIFPGAGEDGNYQISTTITSLLTDREKASFRSSSKITMELDEEYEAGGAITDTVMRRPDNIPIFIDEDLEVLIKPVYTTVNATLSFKYRAKDKVEAQRWRDGVRAKIQAGFRELVHVVDYHYLIPDAILVILQEINRLKENVDGYDESFREYIDNMFTKRKTIVTTLNGSIQKDAIAETQRRVIGWFEFGVDPEKLQSDGPITWTATITYKYSYARPISIAMEYPLVIHNQLIPKKYRPDVLPNPDREVAMSRTLSGKGFSLFEVEKELESYFDHDGVYLPYFDDFIPASTLPHSLRLFTGLILIDMKNPLTLMNYGELGTYKLDPDVEEFLSLEARWIGIPFESVFDISLYENRDLIDHHLNPLRVEENLDVILQKVVSLRNYHHVRLGVCDDWSLLSDDAKRRLRRRPKVLIKLFEWVYRRRWPRDDTDKIISEGDLDGIINDVNNLKPEQRPIHATVMRSIIRAKNIKELK